MKVVLLALFALGAVGCGSWTSDRGEDRLENTFERQANKRKVHNAIFLVDAPSKGIARTWVDGEAASGVAMTEETPFLSASIGKLFVAATVVALEERGELALDDPITAWIPREKLASLPVKGGDDALDEITVEMLLRHRSGLPDYFDGEPRGDAVLTGTFDQTEWQEKHLTYLLSKVLPALDRVEQ